MIAVAETDPAARHKPLDWRSWYTLAVLTMVYTIHSVDRSIISVVIEPVKAEFGLSDGQIGFLTGLAYGATYSLAALPLGFLIDRVNRQRLLAVLVAVWSSCTALCGLAQSYFALVLARLPVGAAEAGGAPTAMSLIGDIFPPRQRTTAIAIFWSSTALGTGASFIIGSIVAVNYGWRAAFLMAGIPGIFLALLLWFTVREPSRESAPAADGSAEKVAAPTLLETWRYAIKQKMLIHVFIGMTLNSMMLTAVLVWQAAFLIRAHDVSLAQAGLLAGLAAGIFGGLGALIGGPLGDRAFKKGGLPALPLVSAATTMVSVACGLLFVFGGSLVLSMAGLILFELLARTYTAPGYSSILGSVEPRMRGVTVSSLQIATNLIGYGGGPFLAGVISDAAGGELPIRWGLFVLMLFGVWASVHYLLAYRAGKRDRDLAVGAVA